MNENPPRAGILPAEVTKRGHAASRTSIDEARARYDQIRDLTPGNRRSVPDTFIPNYVAAYDGTASAREAIRAFCAECCGYDRDAVRECPARRCPLWTYRPWQR